MSVFRRRPRFALRRLSASVTLAMAAAVPLVVPQAACAADSSAALVVDTGSGSNTYCVDLGGKSSVSGLELIKLASKQGLSYGFGYGGQAVCMLNGVGAVSNDCLADQKPYFWGYWHGNGSGGWDWSSTGAGSFSVGPGDIEGWSWDTGTSGSSHAQPPSTTYEDVCGADDSGGGGNGGGGNGGGGNDGGNGGGGGGSKDTGTTDPKDDSGSKDTTKDGSGGSKDTMGTDDPGGHRSSEPSPEPTAAPSPKPETDTVRPKDRVRTNDVNGDTSGAQEGLPAPSPVLASGESAPPPTGTPVGAQVGLVLAILLIGGAAFAGESLRRKRAAG